MWPHHPPVDVVTDRTRFGNVKYFEIKMSMTDGPLLKRNSCVFDALEIHTLEPLADAVDHVEWMAVLVHITD